MSAYYIVSIVLLLGGAIASTLSAMRHPNTFRDLTIGFITLIVSVAWVALNNENQGALLLDTSLFKFGLLDLLAVPVFLMSSLLIGRTGYMVGARKILEDTPS